jgi:hypothetical protein
MGHICNPSSLNKTVCSVGSNFVFPFLVFPEYVLTEVLYCTDDFSKPYQHEGKEGPDTGN